MEICFHKLFLIADRSRSSPTASLVGGTHIKVNFIEDTVGFKDNVHIVDARNLEVRISPDLAVGNKRHTFLWPRKWWSSLKREGLAWLIRM